MKNMVGFVVPVILILHSVYHLGSTTRYLPMVVWDHLNPILSCKNNWLTIPKIDEYDVIRFKCPSEQVPVKLIDYSRIGSGMNENIFRRKWTGGSLDKLKDALENGSFCDPDRKYKKFTCQNGEGKSVSVTFKDTNGYNIGDIFVFYNNGDGSAASLTSTTKQCSMVFIVNITSLDQVDHDISYGKCLNPNDMKCHDINATTCDTRESSTRASPTDASPTDTSPTRASPTDASPTDTSPTRASRTDTSPTRESPTHAGTGTVLVPTSGVTVSNCSEMANLGKQSGACKDRFGYGVLLGIACGCLFSLIVGLLVWLKLRSIQNIVSSEKHPVELELGFSFENKVCEKATQANLSSGNHTVKEESSGNTVHERSIQG